MIDLKTKTTTIIGIIISGLHLVNGLFVGLALYLDGFYKDGTALDDVTYLLLYGTERRVLKGLFLTAFILIWITLPHINVYLGVYYSSRKHLKLVAFIGVVLSWLAFILTFSAHVYIGMRERKFIKNGHAYRFSVAGTVTLGVTSHLSVVFGTRVYLHRTEYQV